ncbi:D-alanyl-D-alanine carboxypeptidase/D-alanyl-D-alanine-endopeptidase [Streptomyces sp. SCUT-3]|uniref:D-alanyl-D-alanine carboxypeptidase/D-alanyl-D-alanine endopeptidase n=1 Tax=Streptomyces sp. SCUT-3 TaxID=2684469 RepID=UPI0015FBB64B|nr:D-alanyl-D-alanine carboxypeptidase/D-alanyl-D-alanine-endopeptidase [Streptomyces sp. SCUT-3]QMV25090.1 D-alanyl-D-alanine carboxypeptidase/D-alanyl-D-alanine-endopeptidase [Streptomyces sp. SCUT-3]
MWFRRASTGRLAAVSAATGLVLALTAVAAAGPWESGRRTAERARAEALDRDPGRAPDAAHRLAPYVLEPLGAPAEEDQEAAGRSGGRRGAATIPVPTRQGLTDALGPLLEDPDLGPDSSAAVIDATTGELLYGARESVRTTPASTVKIATAAAVLEVLGPQYRIPTTVVAGAKPGRIVLVGGGDPTLTARGRGNGDDESAPASLRTLARNTARALKGAGAAGTGGNGGPGGAPKVTLAYDTSRFTGPSLHPIGVNDNIARVTALMADQGRVDPETTGHAPRVADPAASAARTFADLLREEGVEVDGEPRPGRAPVGGEGRLAEVRSQPLSTLVEHMLLHSDNDVAEALARHTALASGRPGSFEGAGDAVEAALRGAGVDLDGAVIADGSGLDRADDVSAGFLASVLALAADPGRPGLRPVLTGLPVAGFSGTLRNRFGDDEEKAAGRASQAAGLVRAKTGTLTGVNTLAGTVVDADGRLLAFAFMTRGTTDPVGAQAALDRLASALANCGCRLAA